MSGRFAKVFEQTFYREGLKRRLKKSRQLVFGVFPHFFQHIPSSEKKIAGMIPWVPPEPDKAPKGGLLCQKHTANKDIMTQTESLLYTLIEIKPEKQGIESTKNLTTLCIIMIYRKQI